MAVGRRGFLAGGSAALVAGCVTPTARRPHVITGFGAREGLANDSRPAIMAAIGAAHDSGGGRVEIPAGLWRCDGPINLKSNVELHVAEGATVRFGTDPRFYLPVVFTRWEGTEAWNYSPLIYTRGERNVAITGPGAFEGQGREHFLPWRDNQGPDQTLIRKMGAEGVPVRDRVFGGGHWLRPHFVQFVECQNVLIDGPTFRDSPFWVIHPVYCRGVVVRNATVISKHVNSDGCDPDSSTDVLIERCHFDVNDDCIAIKSGRDQDAWRVGRPSSRITIRDCYMRTSIAAGLAIGSEMSGGVSDVRADRLTIENAGHAINFKGNLDRGGVVERVRVRDVTVGETNELIQFTTAYKGWRGGNAPPTFRDFVVENVSCRHANKALSIVGVPAAPVQDVRLANIQVAKADTPHEIAHVRNLTLDNVTVNGTRL